MEKLEQGELGQLRWLLGQFLLLVALLGGYTVDLDSGWLVTVGLVLTGGSLFWPSGVARMPALVRRAGPYVILLLVAGDFLMSGGDVLPPLYRMLVGLSVFRALQARTPREDLQQLALVVFLVLLTGVLSLEITFALQLLVLAPLGMALLFSVNLCHREPVAKGTETEVAEDRPDLRATKWRLLLRRVRGRLDRRTLSAGGVLLLGLWSMTALLFLLLPRFDIGQSLPFPQLKTGQSLSGFSDHIRYGDVVSILEDDRIALRVDVPGENPPARPYWRMVVLDAYYDGGFLVSESVKAARRRFQHHRFRFGWQPREEEVDPWTVYLAGGVSAYLPTASDFSRLLFNNRQELQVDEQTRVLRLTEIPASTLSMRYEGVEFGRWLPATEADAGLGIHEPVYADTSQPDYPAGLGYPETLLVVPEGAANRRILEESLAAAQLDREQPARQQVEQLARWLRGAGGYSLETRIPEGEADTVLRWLESGQAGHCELYAGAYALLARAAGFPTRVVTGFAGGDWNGFENYFMVRNRHAHAWCETWIPGEGWLRLDPTPGSGNDPGSVEEALASGNLLLDRTLAAYVDSLRMLWFRRVIQFTEEDQEALGRQAQAWGQAMWEEARSAVAGMTEAIRETLAGLGDRERWLESLRDLAMVVGFLLLVGAGLLKAGRRWRRRGWEERMRRRAGKLLRKASGPALPVGRKEALQRVRYGAVDSWPADVESWLR